jgi:hypothetical protein
LVGAYGGVSYYFEGNKSRYRLHRSAMLYPANRDLQLFEPAIMRRKPQLANANVTGREKHGVNDVGRRQTCAARENHAKTGQRLLRHSIRGVARIAPVAKHHPSSNPKRLMPSGQQTSSRVLDFIEKLSTGNNKRFIVLPASP